MTDYIHQQDGFTLIETLVYVVIISIVITATGSFLFWAIRGEAGTRASGDVSSATHRVMMQMTSEIREAQSVYSPTSAFSTHPGQLSLYTRNHSLADHDFGYVDFFLCDEMVCMKREGDTITALTPSFLRVEELIFDPVTDGSEIIGVRISLTISHPRDFFELDQVISSSVTSSAVMRTRTQ